jgi:restriction endonuclease S subunit
MMRVIRCNLFTRHIHLDGVLAQSRLWPAGTMCITIAANIADTALLGFDACFPDSVVGFIPEEWASDVRFFEYFMRTVKDNLEQFAPATAQKNINLRILESVAVPLAPTTEQIRLADRITVLFSLADSIEAAVEVARRRVESLDQAIRTCPPESKRRTGVAAPGKDQGAAGGAAETVPILTAPPAAYHNPE